MGATVLDELKDVERLEVALAGLAALPEVLAARKEKLFRDVIASKRVDELHASRDAFRRHFDDRIGIAERYQSIAENSGSLLAVEFAAAADELRSQRDELFAKWQTMDDLYRILIELVTPSRERMRELVEKYPAPQSWIDATDNPFVAD